MINLLRSLFGRYRSVLSIKDIALLIYSNIFNNTTYDVTQFVSFILGFDTMRIFGVALVYVFYTSSSMMRFFSGVVIDVLGREKRVLAMSNTLMSVSYVTAFLIIIMMGINSLSLILVLIIIMLGMSVYSAMGVIRSALIKDLLYNDNEKITLYTSLNNALRSLISITAIVISGYLLYLNIDIAKYLILASALLSMVALIPLTLMRHHGRVTDRPSTQVLRQGFVKFIKLVKNNVDFRVVILIMVIAYLLIISLDVLDYSILSIYYNIALLAGVDRVFGTVGAVIGSMLTPRFRVNKLGTIIVLMVIALIVGLGFGIVPMTIRIMIIAVPTLFMLNFIYNIPINAFFTAMGSMLIYATPRGEFGIVYSSMWTILTVSQILSSIIWAFIGTVVGAPEALLIAMSMGIAIFLILNTVYGKVSYPAF
ncbi:MAG: MFS transporter [Caldivirga sp.]|uniref:MFS transporter n=1 Tax=Caldivirga sp. TaxID=2080243 RepID=UPI003D0C8D1E